MKKRIISLVLAGVLLILSLASCGKTQPVNFDVDESGATKLSFKSAASYQDLKKLDGEKVTISGYMATSSPVDGSFIFLMNLPFQSCPFCKPNTSQLSNTMEVYPKMGQTFTYTNQAIRIIGTLEVAKSESDSFTDMYGYEFNFKITEAEYYILTSDDLSAEFVKFQKLSETDVVNEIYNMYNYVNFLCAWPTYTVQPFVDENGNQQNGYYLYDTDALAYIKTENAQFNYGYKEGYFESIIETIEKVDKNEFSDLVENIKKAKALAEKGLSALENGEYTKEIQYVEDFGTNDYIYTLNDGETLANEFNELYSVFADWLASWEM